MTLLSTKIINILKAPSDWATLAEYCLVQASQAIDQIVYRQGYQYINVSPTTIVVPLVVGVVKSPANNCLGLASLELVPPFSLRLDL